MPPASDPEARLEWLRAVIDALRVTRDPKIKPLRKRFARAVVQVQRGTELGHSKEQIAERLDQDFRELQLETYAILLRAVSQLQGVIKVKITKGGGKQTSEMTRSLEDLDAFGSGLRRLVNAMKKGDSDAEAAARRVFESSHLQRLKAD